MCVVYWPFLSSNIFNPKQNWAFHDLATRLNRTYQGIRKQARLSGMFNDQSYTKVLIKKTNKSHGRNCSLAAWWNKHRKPKVCSRWSKSRLEKVHQLVAHLQSSQLQKLLASEVKAASRGRLFKSQLDCVLGHVCSHMHFPSAERCVQRHTPWSMHSFRITVQVPAISQQGSHWYHCPTWYRTHHPLQKQKFHCCWLALRQGSRQSWDSIWCHLDKKQSGSTMRVTQM